MGGQTNKMKSEKLLKPAPAFYQRSASDSALAKHKTKNQDPQRSHDRATKRVQIRWIPPNKGPFTNSMHVAYPPLRVNSSPPSLPTTNNQPRIKPPAPPPPPPGGRIRGPAAPPPPPRPCRTTASAVTPKPPLKALHWSKITSVQQGTIWEELQTHPSEPEIDVSDMETLFSAAKSGGQKKAAAPRSEIVHLVDLKRVNNTEIMLTKVKMPLPDMMAAALALDETVLDADQVENLIKFCPTKDEMELLKNYAGDKAKLGKCEQFFLELMKVPRVESKLRVFLFKIQFNSQITDFKRSLNLVHSACNEVRSSSKLKEVIRIILVMGNTLNNGTPRGGANGFKLDGLLKLNETRAANSKMTLMHYLAKVVAKTNPGLLDLHEDFTSLEASSKIQLEALDEEKQAITKGLEKVNQELAASENDGLVSQFFCKTLKTFIGSVQMEVESVMKFYSIADKNADALVLYFGEEPARCPFEQVTQTLLSFMKSFRKAQEENLKQAEVDRKKALKEAKMKEGLGNPSKG